MTIREEKAPYYLAHLGYRMDDTRHPARQAEIVAQALAAGPPPKKGRKRTREDPTTADEQKAGKRYGVGAMVAWKELPDPQGEHAWHYIRAATYKGITDLLHHMGMVKAYYEYSKTIRPFAPNVEEEMHFLDTFTEWVTSQEDWNNYRARQNAIVPRDMPGHYDKTRVIRGIVGETVARPAAPAAVPLVQPDYLLLPPVDEADADMSGWGDDMQY